MGHLRREEDGAIATYAVWGPDYTIYVADGVGGHGWVYVDVDIELLPAEPEDGE